MLSRLYTLLLVLVVAWSSCAVFGLLGVSVCALIFMCALIFAGRWRTSLLVGLFLVAIVFALLLPAMITARESGRRAQCMNNLRNIGLALLNYEAINKCFPPAYLADKNGKLMHSWRVLILPYLERKDMYEQYTFNEPWDGPNNRKLLAHRPNIFACPGDINAWEGDAKTTSYVAVVGKNALWRAENPRSLNDVCASKGGASGTVMLVEVANSGINWTEPRDFSLDDLAAAAPRDSVPVIRGPHMRSNGYFYHDTPAGANVAFVDGHESFLPTNNLTPDRLSKLFAIGGCNDEGILPAVETEDLRIDWFNCIALTVWIVSVVLLLYRSARSRIARQNVASRTL
jgi:prepilin-type processing-associated H-X9-DG protein